jgi:hypothetical protein
MVPHLQSSGTGRGDSITGTTNTSNSATSDRTGHRHWIQQQQRRKWLPEQNHQSSQFFPPYLPLSAALSSALQSLRDHHNKEQEK